MISLRFSYSIKKSEFRRDIVIPYFFYCAIGSFNYFIPDYFAENPWPGFGKSTFSYKFSYHLKVLLRLSKRKYMNDF